MKFNSLNCLLALWLTLACVDSASAQDKENSPPPEAQVEEMQEWIEYATPGEPHKYLQTLVGEWKTVSTTYHARLDNPIVSEGTAEIESILGGRYIRQKFRGTFAGQRLEGIGITGYDNKQQKYVGTWIDSFGTGIMHNVGEYDPEKHVLTEISTGSSPQGPVKMRLVTKYHSNDRFTMTMYMLPAADDNKDAKEVKTMRIEYTRKKKSKQ